MIELSSLDVLPDLAGSASQEVAKSCNESGIWWNNLKLTTRLFFSTFHLAVTDPPAPFLSMIRSWPKPLDCGQMGDSCMSRGLGLWRTSLRCWFVLQSLTYWKKISMLGQMGFSETYRYFLPQRHHSFRESQREEVNYSRSYEWSVPDTCRQTAGCIYLASLGS